MFVYQCTEYPGLGEPTGQVILATGRVADLDPRRVEQALARRGGFPGMSPARAANWFMAGSLRVDPEDVRYAEPVRDDPLIYEYCIDLLRDVRRLLRPATT